jgi:inhibitor of KinA
LGHKTTYKPYGDSAILIDWHAEISISISNDILEFYKKIKDLKDTNIVEVIIGYSSLTIVFKKRITDYFKEVKSLKEVYNLKDISFKRTPFIWQIPVCYDVDFGKDLQEMSNITKLEISEIITLHSEKLYRVYFIGFLPGFCYLGGLNERLFLERKPNPRLHVAKGSVAIGGKQTGIYPAESAGGWNIIGKTPVDFFNVCLEHPCFVKAGDFIKFITVGKEEFFQIEKEVKDTSYEISKVLYNA